MLRGREMSVEGWKIAHQSALVWLRFFKAAGCWLHGVQIDLLVLIFVCECVWVRVWVSIRQSFELLCVCSCGSGLGGFGICQTAVKVKRSCLEDWANWSIQTTDYTHARTRTNQEAEWQIDGGKECGCFSELHVISIWGRIDLTGVRHVGHTHILIQRLIDRYNTINSVNHSLFFSSKKVVFNATLWVCVNIV